MREKRDSSSVPGRSSPDKAVPDPHPLYQAPAEPKLRLLQVVEILGDFAGCEQPPEFR